MVDEIGDLGAPDLVLAGQAIGVRTGSADKLALNHGATQPCFGHGPGQVLACFSAAQDEQVITLGFRCHLRPPPPIGEIQTAANAARGYRQSSNAWFGASETIIKPRIVRPRVDSA